MFFKVSGEGVGVVGEVSLNGLEGTVGLFISREVVGLSVTQLLLLALFFNEIRNVIGDSLSKLLSRGRCQVTCYILGSLEKNFGFFAVFQVG